MAENSEVHHLTPEDMKEIYNRNEQSNEDNVIQIGQAVVHEFGAGLAVVTSPFFTEQEDGTPLPSAVGICINPDTILTTSGVALLLRHLADSLDSDIDEKIEDLTND